MKKGSILIIIASLISLGLIVLYFLARNGILSNLKIKPIVKNPTSGINSGSPTIEAATTSSQASVAETSTTTLNSAPNKDKPVPKAASIVEPIKYAKVRVMKKPFGLKVSPGHSPVNPEKFSGYHTGVDFETTAAEQNQDVPVYALCDGNLIMKKQATGYGGVAVQSCNLDGRAVTVVYGHLKLDSIGFNVGTKLKAGEQIGILGKGYSQETDRERKHLHLGIHIGTAINILGYVQNKALLSGWLDVLKYLK